MHYYYWFPLLSDQENNQPPLENENTDSESKDRTHPQTRIELMFSASRICVLHTEISSGKKLAEYAEPV
jgi:hypothetical protein